MRQRKEPTEAQREAAKLRREKFRGIVKAIAGMPEAERIALSQKVVAANVEGHVLSLHNQCLLAVQCPHVTVVGGFRQWKKEGRSVRKGEHRHMIWVPMVYGGSRAGNDDTPQPSEVDGEDKTAGVRFLMGTVFDISQTEETGSRSGESGEVAA